MTKCLCAVVGLMILATAGLTAYVPNVESGQAVELAVGPRSETVHVRAARAEPTTTTATAVDVAELKRQLDAATARRNAIEAQRASLQQAVGQPADREVILACIRAHEGGGYTTVSRTGKYRGAYQMDSSFWASYGDGSAPTADQASPQAQDDAAWKGYQARGYGPWPPSQGRCP